MELKKKKIYFISILLLSTFLLVFLSILTFLKILKADDFKSSKKIVATTTMLGNLSQQLTQGIKLNETNDDYFEVKTLMTTGVDPHNYQAKPSDLRHIISADLMVTNGLHLEAQMQKAFQTLCQSENHACEFFSAGEYLTSNNNQDIIRGKSDYPDPHIWFNVDLWQIVCEGLKKEIKKIIKPQDKSKIEVQIDRNFNIYYEKLKKLKEDIIQQITDTNFGQSEVYLITAHDAFSYLCDFLNKIQDGGSKIQTENKKIFKLEPIQGISTQDEVSSGRILELIPIIKANSVKAIFTESSVPENTIKSLKESSLEWVKIVHPTTDDKENLLYSDSLNDKNDYIETFQHNINIIFKYLSKK
ncbi:ABC-type Mn/Zn transport system, periplasmic component [Candidatus Phytoplasma mali]|uniref:ABC-type Mn/Zn transport system, periplasmic component n=1 Tax=Phytoplasma mali (strain AT) TaxID=482235 RepID=B3R029_PHYMT|nr:metal ABC transporter substrate-binding protein [Candidatus Phytoplasma mali]CAP18193.1 ABC-type Mn/Zn transport system, periplasmic component [Candidatus Phytoplasma mali]CAP18679.1 ABC-type Mn/Zn transport system, periplasmic component [Candidatus Phytoplasma mali]